MELDQQKCESCEGINGALSKEEAEGMLGQTPGWEIVDNTIQRTFALPNFVDAMQFANRITPIAEQENHHPDVHVSWGKVRVELSTHSVGGLSRNDFILAAKINRLWEERHGA